MKFYRLTVVYSVTQMVEDVYNDKSEALKAFNAAASMGLILGAKLYTCAFENGKLKNNECIKQYNK